MKLAGLIECVQALQAAQIPYLVVGGYAVLAHGHLRATHDLDLVIDFSEDVAHRLVKVLSDLGYVPRAPVSLSDLANSEVRQEWITTKNAEVFSVRREASAGQLADEIDIFLESPFDFTEVYPKALRQEVGGQVVVTFVDRATLMDMKRKAGRPKDIEDLIALRDGRTHEQ